MTGLSSSHCSCRWPSSAFCTSNVSVSTEGRRPHSPSYVIRFTACSNYEAALLQPIYALFDVLLSEGEPGGVEVRYYQVPAISSQYSAVGIHGNVDLQQFTQLNHYGYTQLTPTVASQLTGATVTFQYTGKSAEAGCTAFGVDFSPVSQSDLVYVNASAGYTIYARPCGQVNATACSTNPTTAAAAVCQVGTAGPTSLSEYTPGGVSYSSSPAGPGVRQTLQDGAYCGVSGGSYNPRVTNTDYLCVKGNSTTALLRVVENPACTFTLSIQTPAGLLCDSGLRHAGGLSVHLTAVPFHLSAIDADLPVHHLQWRGGWLSQRHQPDSPAIPPSTSTAPHTTQSRSHPMGTCRSEHSQSSHSTYTPTTQPAPLCLTLALRPVVRSVANS